MWLCWCVCRQPLRYWLHGGARAHGQLRLLHPLVHVCWRCRRLQPGWFRAGPRGRGHEGPLLILLARADERVLIAVTLSLSQIPLLQRAQAASPRPLDLMASAWSAPAWMKTNGALTGKGSLKGQPGGKEHKTWAHYYIRWGCDGVIIIRSNFTSCSLTPGNLALITSGSWKNMQNTIWAFGHWPQGMSPLQEWWRTTGLSLKLFTDSVCCCFCTPVRRSLVCLQLPGSGFHSRGAAGLGVSGPGPCRARVCIPRHTHSHTGRQPPAAALLG